MRIDGKAVAQTILTKLTQQVIQLKGQGLHPTLVVIFVGDNSNSASYIRQKQKTGEAIGARVRVDTQPATITPADLETLITKYNNDPHVHGLIVQRPLPPELGDSESSIVKTVHMGKDVDGFVPNSPFNAPVAQAVIEILKSVYFLGFRVKPGMTDFARWLQSQKIVVLGRGETAGRPIALLFQKLQCATSIIHSQTPNPKEILNHADIVVSCIGKPHAVKAIDLKKGAIVISVGLTKNSEGKLISDYNEEEIDKVASWYTTTPGGVGPVNVACLMQNLINACIMKQGGSL